MAKKTGRLAQAVTLAVPTRELRELQQPAGFISPKGRTDAK